MFHGVHILKEIYDLVEQNAEEIISCKEVGKTTLRKGNSGCNKKMNLF